jgi:hypothetical protein
MIIRRHHKPEVGQIYKHKTSGVLILVINVHKEEDCDVECIRHEDSYLVGRIWYNTLLYKSLYLPV